MVSQSVDHSKLLLNVKFLGSTPLEFQCFGPNSTADHPKTLSPLVKSIISAHCHISGIKARLLWVYLFVFAIAPPRKRPKSCGYSG